MALVTHSLSHPQLNVHFPLHSSRMHLVNLHHYPNHLLRVASCSKVVKTRRSFAGFRHHFLKAHLRYSDS